MGVIDPPEPGDDSVRETLSHIRGPHDLGGYAQYYRVPAVSGVHPGDSFRVNVPGPGHPSGTPRPRCNGPEAG